MTVCLLWQTVGGYVAHGVKLHTLIFALDWDESSTSQPGLSAPPPPERICRCTFIWGCIGPRLNLVSREGNLTQVSYSHWAASWCDICTNSIILPGFVSTCRRELYRWPFGSCCIPCGCFTAVQVWQPLRGASRATALFLGFMRYYHTTRWFSVANIKIYMKSHNR
jgi:hypothetical protein